MLTPWKFHPCARPSCRKRSMLFRFRVGPELIFRGKGYCSVECFQEAATEIFAELLLSRPVRIPRRHRLPLGLLMLSEGWISEQDLTTALHAQRSARNGRLGEWICRLGAASEEQVTAAVGIKWAKPVFALERSTGFPQCAGLVPATILESAVMVPAYYAPDRRVLYTAFAHHIDYSVLGGIERMLNCRTDPCLARESSIQRLLEAIRQQPRPMEIRFDGMRESHEMARVAASYAAKVGAEDIQVEKCGPHLWVQLRAEKTATNLIFGLRVARETDFVPVLSEAEEPHASHGAPNLTDGKILPGESFAHGKSFL